MFIPRRDILQGMAPLEHQSSRSAQLPILTEKISKLVKIPADLTEVVTFKKMAQKWPDVKVIPSGLCQGHCNLLFELQLNSFILREHVNFARDGDRLQTYPCQKCVI